MKIGDLVRITSEWVYHNPWMKPYEPIKIGLVVGFYSLCEGRSSCYGKPILLVEGEENVYHNHILEVICK